jgi:hypothetical protein
MPRSAEALMKFSAAALLLVLLPAAASSADDAAGTTADAEAALFDAATRDLVVFALHARRCAVEVLTRDREDAWISSDCVSMEKMRPSVTETVRTAADLPPGAMTPAQQDRLAAFKAATEAVLASMRAAETLRSVDADTLGLGGDD